MKKILSVMFVFIVVASPLFVFVESAQAGDIVPCGIGNSAECTICDLVVLAQNVLNALIFLSIILSVLLFLYAGVLYVLSSANPNNISKAHSVFKTALIGFIVVLAAWLFIGFVMESLFVGSPLADRMHVTPGDTWGSVLCDNSALGG